MGGGVLEKIIRTLNAPYSLVLDLKAKNFSENNITCKGQKIPVKIPPGL
jgi:hypothetical protein